eukprot:2312432-Pleurochrysis_carterae.AAC.1
MEPSKKNIALLLYDKETNKTVEISPVWPALNFTHSDVTMFTLHPDIIAKSILHASFSANYDDPYNVRRYKLIQIKNISYKKNYPICPSLDDFFPMLDNDEVSDDESEIEFHVINADEAERQALQDELEGGNSWGAPIDYY